MTKGEKLNQLLIEYMYANPNATNPGQNIFIFGIDGLIDLLTEANNRLIVFEIEPDVQDGIFATIDGKRF